MTEKKGGRGEAGILPLNYSSCVFRYLTVLQGVSCFPARPYSLCNPSRTMGSDRKMDSKTDSKPAPKTDYHKTALDCALPLGRRFPSEFTPKEKTSPEPIPGKAKAQRGAA